MRFSQETIVIYIGGLLTVGLWGLASSGVGAAAENIGVMLLATVVVAVIVLAAGRVTN